MKVKVELISGVVLQGSAEINNIDIGPYGDHHKHILPDSSVGIFLTCWQNVRDLPDEGCLPSVIFIPWSNVAVMEILDA